MSKTKGLFKYFILFAFFAFGFVFAQEAAFSLKIDKNVAKLPDGSYSIKAELIQIGDRIINPVFYQIIATSEDGTLVFKTPLKKLNFDTLTKKAALQERFTPQVSVNSKLFLVFKNQQGSFLLSTYLDELKANKKQEELIKLENCSLFVENSQLNIACSTNANSKDRATLTVEVLGNKDQLAATYQLQALPEKGKIKLSTPISLKPGKYTAYLKLSQNDSVSGEVVKTFEVPGDWVAITQFSISDITKGNYNVYFVFDGSPKATQPRGLFFWILDENSNICVSKHIDLSKMPPYEYVFSGNIPVECSSPKFAAALYNGKDETGNYRIVDTIGDEDFLSLIKQTTKNSSTNKTPTSLLIVSLVLVAVAILGLIFSVFDRNKKAAFLLLLVLAPAISVAASTYAQVFRTYDNPNATVSVEFSRDKFAPNSKVVFTITIHDNMRQKRTKGDLYAKINDGEYIKIAPAAALNNSDLFIDYIIQPELTAPADEGINKLYIKIPGMCGSAFDFSRFDAIEFGTKDCEFIYDFEVKIPIECKNDPENCNIDDYCIDGKCFNAVTPSDPVADIQCSVENNINKVKIISYYDYNEDGIQDDVAYVINTYEIGSIRIPKKGYTKAGEFKEISVNSDTSALSGVMYVETPNGAQSDVVPLNLRCGGVSACGNGIYEPNIGEQCDDGNTISGDGCSAICKCETYDCLNHCGNNIAEPQFGEQCDGVDTPIGKQCTPYCLLKETCEAEISIRASQNIVRQGGQVQITWTPPRMAESCALYANGRKVMDNAKYINRYVETNFQGETLYEIRCNSCGTVVSTSTRVYMLSNFQER